MGIGDPPEGVSGDDDGSWNLSLDQCNSLPRKTVTGGGDRPRTHTHTHSVTNPGVVVRRVPPRSHTDSDGSDYRGTTYVTRRTSGSSVQNLCRTMSPTFDNLQQTDISQPVTRVSFGDRLRDVNGRRHPGCLIHRSRPMSVTAP